MKLTDPDVSSIYKKYGMDAAIDYIFRKRHKRNADGTKVKPVLKRKAKRNENR